MLTCVSAVRFTCVCSPTSHRHAPPVDPVSRTCDPAQTHPSPHSFRRAGQTQTADPEPAGDRVAVWAHPLDLHYVTGSAQGWPRLVVEVHALDAYGRLALAGYGTAALPVTPGAAELRVPTWRPLGTPEQERAAFFLGTPPALAGAPTAAALGDASADRLRLTSVSAGVVHVRVHVLLRHAGAHGVDA